MKNRVLILASILAAFMVAGCSEGNTGYESGVDPNKNPHYVPTEDGKAKKDTKGGFVPDLAPDK